MKFSIKGTITNYQNIFKISQMLEKTLKCISSLIGIVQTVNTPLLLKLLRMLLKPLFMVLLESLLLLLLTQ